MSQIRVFTAFTMSLWLGSAAAASPPLTPNDFPACPAGTHRKDLLPPEPHNVHCQDLQGRLQGPFLFWHGNGVLGVQGSYLDNAKHGWWSTWDDQGALIGEQEYWHGEVIARKRLPQDGPARPSQATDAIHPCPKGTVVGRSGPPAAGEEWCEKRRKDGTWVRQGPWMSWLRRTPSPVVYKRGFYQDGLREGAFTEYWENGKARKESHYSKGIQGSVISFYEAGAKESEIVPSADGQGRRVTRWREDGSPQQEDVWGPRNTLLRMATWYRNGKKAHEQSFVEGRPRGIERKWWLNGQLWEEGENHEGTHVGTWKQWSPDGTLMQVETRDAEGNVDRQTFVVFADDAPEGSLTPVPQGPLRPDAPLHCPPGTQRFQHIYIDLALVPRFKPLASEIDSSLIDACGFGGPSIRFQAALWDLESREKVTGGELHGPYIEWDAQGRKRSEIEYQHGKKHGRSVGWQEDGKTSGISFFEDDLLDGPSATWYRNGARQAVETYRGGKIEGAWFHYRENGLHDERGAYHEGKKNGLWIAWWEDGTKKSEQEFRDDKPEGRSATWDFDGELAAQGEYRAGVKEGHWIERDAAGRRTEGDYKNGQRDGYWTFYDQNGLLAAEGRYERYRRVGTWTLYENGRPSAWGNYVWCDKVPSRSETTIIETGQKMWGLGAGEGCKQGVWTLWHSTGELHGTAIYNEAPPEPEQAATVRSTTK